MLLGDPQQHARQLLAFVGAERRAQRLLMLPGDPPDRIQHAPPRVGQAHGIPAAVVWVVASLDQPARLQLVQQGDEPAGEYVQMLREGLLARIAGARQGAQDALKALTRGSSSGGAVPGTEPSALSALRNVDCSA